MLVVVAVLIYTMFFTMSVRGATQCFPNASGIMTCVDHGYDLTHVLSAAALVFIGWFIYYRYNADKSVYTVQSQAVNENINQLRREYANIENKLSQDAREQLTEVRSRLIEFNDITNGNIQDVQRMVKMLVNYFENIERKRQANIPASNVQSVASNNPAPETFHVSPPKDNVKVTSPVDKSKVDEIVERSLNMAPRAPPAPQSDSVKSGQPPKKTTK